jgi:hypothetical protein
MKCVRGLSIKVLIVMSIIAATHKPAISAQDCPYSVYNSANSYANRIVTNSNNWSFLLPMNMRTSVEECTYFPNEGAFILYMRINWQHPWVQDKPYSAVVRVESTSNGSWSWSLKDANSNLMEHLVTIGVIKVIAQ